ncbi:MAG: hypothetical protein JRN61_00325, partial [Nitrososphaerota archaeon]|nr:hypothetical protein [Nitrososphaerota archaeon]
QKEENELLQKLDGKIYRGKKLMEGLYSWGATFLCQNTSYNMGHLAWPALSGHSSSAMHHITGYRGSSMASMIFLSFADHRPEKAGIYLFRGLHYPLFQGLIPS